jgi:hypothetical protein
MAASDVIVTSDYSNLTTGAITGRLGRTSAKTGVRGRARMSVEIIAEPLSHNFDDLQLGKGPSAAIADALRRSVEGITETVSDRTLETRKYQEKAFAVGKPWVQARFGGGRMADTPPRPGEARHFQHSGRIAKSIVATENKTEKSWTVNVAANRLDPRTSRGAGDFAFITETLIRLVPAFGDPRKLADHPLVRAAIEKSIGDLIADARSRNLELLAALRKAKLDLFKGGARGVIRTILG